MSLKLFAVICGVIAVVRGAAIDDDFDPEVSLNEYELVIGDFEPIPLQIASHRQRRQVVTGGITPGQPGGVQGNLGVAGTLYEKNGHRLDGHGEVSRNWKPNGPTTVGGGLDYTGPRGSASVNALHQRHLGTSVSAEGRANLYTSPNGRSTLDATGGYQRHFGGPWGTSRPNYNVGLGFQHRF